MKSFLRGILAIHSRNGSKKFQYTLNIKKTRRSIKAYTGLPVVGGGCTKTEGTELGGIECRVPVNFFNGGGSLRPFEGHPHVAPAEALWLTRSHI